MLARPVLRGLLAMNLAVSAATALVVVNTVVYVRDLLHGPSSAVALALGCYGGGSMLVALSVPRLLRQVPDRLLMLTGAALTPVGLLAAAILSALTPTPAPGWALLAAAWIVLGAGTSLINTPSARLLRAQSGPDTRTAVFTAQFSLSHACFLLTYPIAGWIGAAAGQLAAAVALTAVATLAATTAARLWPVGVTSGVEPVTAESR